MFDDDQRCQRPLGSLPVWLPGARLRAESLPICRLTLVAHRLFSATLTLHRYRSNVRFLMLFVRHLRFLTFYSHIYHVQTCYLYPPTTTNNLYVSLWSFKFPTITL